MTFVARQLHLTEPVTATDTEAQLLGHLSKEAIHVDDLCRSSGLPAATVAGTLAMLELKGLVKPLGSMNYVLA